MAAILINVRFTPESGHWNSAMRCPLCANSFVPKADIQAAVGYD
jgi:hypothetical protein